MSQERYFILHEGEDGISIHVCKDKAEVSKYIDVLPGEDTNYFGCKGDCFIRDNWLKGDVGIYKLDEGKLLIIKGEVIVPKPREVVREWSVP